MEDFMYIVLTVSIYLSFKWYVLPRLSAFNLYKQKQASRRLLLVSQLFWGQIRSVLWNSTAALITDDASFGELKDNSFCSKQDQKNPDFFNVKELWPGKDNHNYAFQ